MPLPSSWQAVIDQIDDQVAISLARSLIQIPSVTGVEGEAISLFIADWLRAHGIDSGLQRLEPGRANVFGHIGPNGGPTLLLNGHLDTKPYDNMTIPPTEGLVRAGRLYGRGACDMKAALAAMMVALAAISAARVPLSGRLIFGAEVGEEGGGWRLLDLLAGPGQADAVICGEPTNLELHIGNRGWFQCSLRTTGVATHSGTAREGINAIEKMATVVTAVYGLRCFQPDDPIWGRSPVNAQFIHGGGKVTGAVADECVVHFDIRLNPDLSPDHLANELESALAGLRQRDPQLRVEWEYRPDWPQDLPAAAPAVHLPPTHPFVTAVAGAFETVTGAPPRFAGFPGGCAAGICLERGTPAVVLGPGSLAQAHSADEWVEVDQIAVAARVYALAALRVLG